MLVFSKYFSCVFYGTNKNIPNALFFRISRKNLQTLKKYYLNVRGMIHVAQQFESVKKNTAKAKDIEKCFSHDKSWKIQTRKRPDLTVSSITLPISAFVARINSYTPRTTSTDLKRNYSDRIYTRAYQQRR